MTRLDLFGCTVASFTAGGELHVVDAKRGGVICTAARKMLALGMNPAEEIDVRRDGRPVFLGPINVGWWAARTVVEDGEQGPRIRRLRPMDGPDNANSASRAPRWRGSKTAPHAPSVGEGA